MRRFLAVLRSFFHSSLLRTFSYHPSPPTILPSSFTSSCHLFLDLPLSLLVPTFIYNTHLGILFSSILCTCPNQRNLFNLIVSIIVGFLTLVLISFLVNILFSKTVKLVLESSQPVCLPVDEVSCSMTPTTHIYLLPSPLCLHVVCRDNFNFVFSVLKIKSMADDKMKLTPERIVVNTTVMLACCNSYP